MPKRNNMLLAFSARIVRASLASLVCFVVLGTRSPAGTSAPQSVDLATILAGYAHATVDPNAAPIVTEESTGTLSGGGLTGTFHDWTSGERERTDENLGPRADTVLRIGDRFWERDANGDARELTGVLARRARTQHFIDSGDFVRAPDRVAFRGRATIAKIPAYVLDVSARDGETESLVLDARTYLPIRLSYDDDDGRTTVDFSDWRDVDGHHFAFRNVVSDGDHAFDTVQLTDSVTIGGRIADATFAPLVPRIIAMSGTQTVPLELHEGHLYAPVTIAGHAYTFLLDTGAQDIVIDRKIALDLGLVPTGSLEASGATRTGGLQLVTLASIGIGRGTLTNIIASTIDLAASTSGVFRIDGILGYPFFGAAAAKIDYGAKTLTFGAPGAFADAGEKIPVQVDRSFPEAMLLLDGSTDAPFIIDTGNAGELLLYKPFLDTHAGIVPFSSTDRHSFGIGGATLSYRSSLESITFGDIALYHADTDVMLATSGAFADRFDAGNVGLGLLKNFVVTFDLANAAMYLQRGANFDDGRSRN